MKVKFICKFFVVALLALSFSSCNTGSESKNSDYSDAYEDSYVDNEDDSESYALSFNSSRDVFNYLNGKTFSGDGLNIRFSNNGQSVSVNGENISNDVDIYDIGINDNGVSYATVVVANPAGVTTTFTLLAVSNQAQLIDPNDGTVYEY